jgi:hypothetical protein
MTVKSGRLARAAARARARAGRRGAFLAFLAVLDAAFGYSLLTVPRAGIGSYDFVLPVHAWGWAWIGTGVICALGVAARSDRVAYTMAALLKATWGLTYAWLWWQGSPSAWVSVAVWLSFALVVVLVAGWPEEVTGDVT